jgi:hypothetical protein
VVDTDDRVFAGIVGLDGGGWSSCRWMSVGCWLSVVVCIDVDVA